MKRILFITAILIAALTIGVSDASAQDGGSARNTLEILSEPTALLDLFLNGVLLETVYGYSDIEPLEVAWQPVPGATAYGLVLYKYDVVADTGHADTVQEGYHWASNPNGTCYTFGGYAEPVCANCIYYIYAYPMDVMQYYDPTTDTYEYAYDIHRGAGSFVNYSDDFVFHR
jgi:hypothetical protein